MPETTPLIKAALNLRVGAGFDVYKQNEKDKTENNNNAYMANLSQRNSFSEEDFNGKEYVYCTACGNKLSIHSRFCTKCGAENSHYRDLSVVNKEMNENVALRFCTQCGKPLSDMEKYCTACGTPANVVENTIDEGEEKDEREEVLS